MLIFHLLITGNREGRQWGETESEEKEEQKKLWLTKIQNKKQNHNKSDKTFKSMTFDYICLHNIEKSVERDLYLQERGEKMIYEKKSMGEDEWGRKINK